DTVVAQDPAPGKKIETGKEVRINISKGPQQVFVPPVQGLLYEDAAAQLQQAGFAVARVDEDSTEQKGVVIGQNPRSNSAAAKGSKVTLSVSKGPTAVGVPDVFGLDQASATSELEGAGLKVRVRDRGTDDEAADGTVVEQRPASGTQVRPGTTVTIVIARFTGAPPPAGTTTTP
ncbi:MAG: PASTA domain-containing protein, partial [Thermoleophilia bacterium]|nr:PASTA domain-containing protein [Thermoleophilia bacterium]